MVSSFKYHNYSSCSLCMRSVAAVGPGLKEPSGFKDPLTLSFLFIPCTLGHGNKLCSNHGDADENGDDDVDCHGNTGWVVGRVWDEIASNRRVAC